jgi:transposase-like protein
MMYPKLWKHMNEEHGLLLLETELTDIVEAVRQEIEPNKCPECRGEMGWTKHEGNPAYKCFTCRYLRIMNYG